jgi:hypothetical protein
MSYQAKIENCTVAKLIAELEKCDPDNEVWVQTTYDSDSDNVMLENFQNIVEIWGTK